MRTEIVIREEHRTLSRKQFSFRCLFQLIPDSSRQLTQQATRDSESDQMAENWIVLQLVPINLTNEESLKSSPPSHPKEVTIRSSSNKTLSKSKQRPTTRYRSPVELFVRSSEENIKIEKTLSYSFSLASDCAAWRSCSKETVKEHAIHPLQSASENGLRRKIYREPTRRIITSSIHKRWR